MARVDHHEEVVMESRGNGRTWCFGVLTGAAVLATVLGGAAVAGASEDGSKSLEVARSLQERWSTTIGYSGVVWDRSAESVSVFWHGSVPDGLRSQVQAEADRGVRVSIQPGEFTAEQLQAEAQRLADTYPFVKTVSPRSDGSGLDVGLDAQTLKDAQLRGVDPMAGLSRFPTTVTGDADPQPL
jgi:hypothetical protein